MDSIFKKEDLDKFESRGISPEDVRTQMKYLTGGISSARLTRPCTVRDGIRRLEENEITELKNEFSQAVSVRKVTKFVPASGAASRMFKNLQTIMNKGVAFSLEDLRAEADKGDEVAGFTFDFFNSIEKFAFYSELNRRLESEGYNLRELLDNGNCLPVLRILLTSDGLDYARLPKGLIPFHEYNQDVRTPFEEHIYEATDYTRDADGNARVHFTIPEKHIYIILEHYEQLVEKYKLSGHTVKVDYSIQKASTDTIALDMNNELVRDADGSILFRPGGHGALLENLYDLKGDIVFIKNIDNVVPDHLKETTSCYKRALGGLLIKLQAKAFGCIERLTGHVPSDSDLVEIINFLKDEINLDIPQEYDSLQKFELRDRLLYLLNRPLRVCGVVKNVGETGGAPFWVNDRNGNIAKQIIESSQVNLDDPDQKAIWESATHFNPVDLVCGLKDYKGKQYILKDFSDPSACFVSVKYKNGRELKALELPGLWNGGMAGWNTVFVEVPLITFNPVKTVNDLLRPEHQPEMNRHHV